MNFDLAQVFFVDPAIVNQAAEVSIHKISLFFSNKPKITGNKSGIYAPGVEVFLVPTFQGVPVIERAGFVGGTYRRVQISRREYNEINVSASSNVATEFFFSVPVCVQTNREYAIIVKFDGREDFKLWTSKQGDPLVGTLVPSPGPSGAYVGKFFTYIGPPNYNNLFQDNSSLSDSFAVQSSSTQSQLSQTPNLDFLLSAWKPLNDTDLKFKVDAARFSHLGSPVASNTDLNANTSDTTVHFPNSAIVLANNIIRVTAPALPMEYVYYNKKLSATNNLKYGDHVFQSQPYYPGGTATPATCNVKAGSLLITCNTSYVLADNTTFDWTDLYDFNSWEYIVVTSLNHDGANRHRIEVRKIMGSANATAGQMVVESPFSFTNSAAYFYKSPVGRLYSKSRPYVTGFTQDLIVLSESNANATVRFVNNQIANVTINDGGASYANSDYLIISGYEAVTNEVLGGYSAKANLVTNSTGGITAVYISNAGCGFVNSASITYVIANSSASNSTGTGANLSFGVDTILYTSQGNGNTYFKGASIVNFDSQYVVPVLDINNPLGTIYSIKYKSLYHSSSSANTFSGKLFRISPTDAAMSVDVKNKFRYHFTSDKRPCIVSRSNQFVISYANGYIPNTSIIGGPFTSNTAVFQFDIYSNNDFASISFNPKDLNSFYGKYNINNDYTNEHTNYGNAYSKHVASKVNFANNKFAEDILVFLTVHRPANTDLKVYTRLHNSADSEAFDDKDWTLLEQIDGLGVYSNPSNPTDMIELTYGLPLYPNAEFVCNGVVSTSLSSVTVTGTNTTFSSNLVAGDLVRIYQPLFPNSDYVIAVVNVVTNATSLTLRTPIANASVVGSGLKMEKLRYPMQAFKNGHRDNVARYYNSSKIEFDTFDTFQLKIVFLSNNEWIVPKVDDIQVVGVTA